MPRFTENYEQSYQFPIGIAYVSASLKNSGRDVLSYNLNYKQGTVKELIKKDKEKEKERNAKKRKNKR